MTIAPLPSSPRQDAVGAFVHKANHIDTLVGDPSHAMMFRDAAWSLRVGGNQLRQSAEIFGVAKGEQIVTRFKLKMTWWWKELLT